MREERLQKRVVLKMREERLQKRVVFENERGTFTKKGSF